MLRSLLTVGLTAAVALTSATTFSAQAPAPKAAAPIVILETEKGQIEIETLPGDAPKAVERFVELAKRGFYREHRFHWVQANLVQSGDPLSRDPNKVLVDVRDGYVSVAGAARDYAVVIVGDPDTDPEGLTVDESATAALRRTATAED